MKLGEHRTYQGAFLEKDQVECDLRNRACREAHDKIAAMPGHCSHRRLGETVAHRVIDDVDALATWAAMCSEVQKVP